MGHALTAHSAAGTGRASEDSLKPLIEVILALEATTVKSEGIIFSKESGVWHGRGGLVILALKR